MGCTKVTKSSDFYRGSEISDFDSRKAQGGPEEAQKRPRQAPARGGPEEAQKRLRRGPEEAREKRKE